MSLHVFIGICFIALGLTMLTIYIADKVADRLNR